MFSTAPRVLAAISFAAPLVPVHVDTVTNRVRRGTGNTCIGNSLNSGTGPGITAKPSIFISRNPDGLCAPRSPYSSDSAQATSPIANPAAGYAPPTPHTTIWDGLSWATAH